MEVRMTADGNGPPSSRAEPRALSSGLPPMTRSPLLLALCLAVPLFAACKNTGGGVKLEAPSASWPSLSEAPPAKGNPAMRDAAVVIAIEDYSFVDDIPGARANAQDWVQFLAKSQGVPEQNIYLSWNFEATKENILADIDKATRQVAPGGRLWFVFIGHGAPNRSGNDAWLVGADAQRSPESLAQRGLSQAEVVAKLEAVEGVTPIVVLDACFNGQTSSGGRLMEAGLQDLAFIDLRAGSKAIVLSASKKDEYAGPLPGASRPAFSYLLLGAMRGWGDENKDGSVTVNEAVNYSQRALGMLVKGRRQTPEIIGDQGGAQLLAVSAGESGPDLTEMRIRGAGANETTIQGDTLAVPDAELLHNDVDFSAKSDMAAEKLYGEALTAQKDPEELPEVKASRWCALARMNAPTNPYRVQALKMCRDWQIYARALREKESSMVRDYEYLREYLLLGHKTQDQKLAAASAFISGYGDMSEADYPHLRHVKRAQRKLKTSDKAKMPSLSSVRVVPEGSPSNVAPGTDAPASAPAIESVAPGSVPPAETPPATTPTDPTATPAPETTPTTTPEGGPIQ
jgi:hypothetical protein